MPVPSLMSNCLLSLPSGCSRILPSVSTPSTSKRTSLIWRACASITAPSPEVVQVDDAGDALRVVAVGNDDRRDLALLHELERFGRQRARRDGDRISGHHILRVQLEDVV